MYYNVKSLILRSNATAEADKTIVAYTLDWGKIMLSVPGAKKITAKLSNITEPLTQAELSIYMPSESARGKVTGGTLINGYWGLKKSFKRHVYAMYASEIAEKLAPFNSAGETKYLLISRVWEILESSPNPLKTLTAFTLRMLKISGYSFSDYLINSGAPCRAEMFD
ncbi:MAG: DNA repair protein RecO, partial [Elusimicrobia bacterium]|nr:DNA repair protein RecO [Elusimicrobiota bacterium]